MESSVLISLLNYASYPAHTSTVELVQTHVSWIFLTDTHAYKIKKPVDFGFLNFTTIEKRLFFCNEEIRLNRRLCPDLYLGVVELRSDTGGASFVGNGPVIDYAVKMKRLPSERMLANLVEKGQATPEMLRAVARKISRFHAEADTSPNISGFGSLDTIMSNWLENFEQMIVFSDKTLPADDCNFIRSWVADFVRNNTTGFTERVTDNRIRECDGDIHLDNICMSDNGIYIFDCIEFNERFRFCDTASDLAFLLMDLDYHGRNDLARAVIETYRNSSNDSTIDNVLVFYLVYRAFIRGKVESLQLTDSTISQDMKDQAVIRAKRYFSLARGYCARSAMLQPTLIITCGSMGCGKTELATQLGFELGIPVYSSDITRKSLAGIPAERASHDIFGQGLYSETTTESVYKKLLENAVEELSSGRSVIIDASFSSSGTRKLFAETATSYGAELIILQVSCSYEEQIRRLEQRTASGNSVSDGRVELLQQQKLQFEYPHPDEGRVVKVDSTDTPARLTRKIYRELGL